MAELARIGNFELLERIGQGGMGTVFKARQISMDRIVAVKILPPSLARQQQFIERFLREARASARLNHPNVVNGIDVGNDEATGLYYFAMEYIEGVSVKYILAHKERFSELQAAKIGKAMAQALAHAHAHGILHRDIKPDNILIDRSGTPKLCDLGLARLDAESEVSKGLTQQGFAVGTPHYISPEQARGAQDLDAATDLYSLGATLYRMLTGRTMFEGATSVVVMTKHITAKCAHPNEAGAKISRGMVLVLAKLLAKERTARYASARLLAEDLDRVARGKSPRHADLPLAQWPFASEGAHPLSAPSRGREGERGRAAASVQEKPQHSRPVFAPLTSALAPRGRGDLLRREAPESRAAPHPILSPAGRGQGGGMRWYVWAGIAVLALLSADAYFEYSGEGIWGLWANRKAPAAPVPAEALTSSSPLTGGPGQVAAQPGTGPGGLKTSSPSVSPHPGAIGSKKPNAGDRQPISKQPEIGVGPRAQAPQSKDSAALAPLEIKAKPTETQLPPASAHAPEDSSKATPGTELAGLIERALVSGAESKFREAAEVFRLPAEKLGQLDRFDRELARIHAEGYSGLADMKTLIIERLKSDPNKFDATMVLAKLPGGKLAGGDDRELRIKGPQVELPYLWSKLLLEDLHTLGSYVLSALPANGSLGLAVMSYDLNTDKDDAFARKVLAPLILPSPPRGEGGVRGARRLLELIDLRQELALAKKQAVQNAYAEKLLYELDLAMTQGDFAGVPAKAEQFRAKHADTEMIKARSEDLKTYVESAKLCKQLSVVTQPGNVALAGNGAVASGSPSARLLVDGNCTEYSSDAGFAFLTWPDKWIVTLPKVYLLREIRMLLWDVDAERFYRYQIETSYDGEHYTLHEDRSKGEWRTWQVLKFAPWPVKSIRITGTYCSANATFHVVELEAYCIPPDTPLPSRKPGLPAPALRPPPKVPPQPAPKKGAP